MSNVKMTCHQNM